jgi:hypothetical protein
LVCVDWGYLGASVPAEAGLSEDRGVIVPSKPVKAGGGKDVRKSECCEATHDETNPGTSAQVGYADGRD